MQNYSSTWKKQANFKQVSYDDFVTEYDNITNEHIMEKVDGMLGAFVYREGKEAFFQTTRGHIIDNIPAINEYGVRLKNLGIKNIVIMGELVAIKGGTILPFNETMSIVKTFHRPANKDLIHHYPFDIFEVNGRKMNFKESIKMLFSIIGVRGFTHIHLPKMVVGGIKEFREFYKYVHERPGYDGVVVMDVGGKNIKVKFTNTVDLVVIGAGHVDMKAWQKDQISYLIPAFIDKRGYFRSSSKVGTGFDMSFRRKLYDYFNKNKLFQRDGDLFVAPKMVIEVKFFRYRITKTPIFKYERNYYIGQGRDKSITFSHPSFQRVREDKSANKIDVRLEQIPEWEY
jgi:ATP-dependent DNA ligase